MRLIHSAFLGIFFYLILPAAADAQRTDTGSQNKPYKRMAHVDISIVQRQYRRLSSERVQNEASWNLGRDSLQHRLDSLDTAAARALQADSSTGGTRGVEIRQRLETQKAQVRNTYDNKMKANHAQHVAFLQQCDKEIRNAINEILVEKGFTGFESKQDSEASENENITQLVVQKLQ